MPTNMKTPDGKLPYQVCALRDFAGVKAGKLGGYVGGEKWRFLAGERL
jgi:hypothetical protein